MTLSYVRLIRLESLTYKVIAQRPAAKGDHISGKALAAGGIRTSHRDTVG